MPFHLLPPYLFSISNVGTLIGTHYHIQGRELYSGFTALRCMFNRVGAHELASTRSASHALLFHLSEYVTFNANVNIFSRLSSEHDGDGNTCNRTSYFIMAPSSAPVQNQNPWKFSQCSVDYFTTFINKLNQ